MSLFLCLMVYIFHLHPGQRFGYPLNKCRENPGGIGNSRETSRSFGFLRPYFPEGALSNSVLKSRDIFSAALRVTWDDRLRARSAWNDRSSMQDHQQTNYPRLELTVFDATDPSSTAKEAVSKNWIVYSDVPKPLNNTFGP